MFYYTLAMSVILVAAAHASATRSPKSIRWWLFVCVGTLGNFLCFIIQPLAIWLLSCTLAIALVTWSVFRERSRWFLPYSTAAVVVAYAWPVANGLHYLTEAYELRAKYAIESMEDRAPEPRPELHSKVLTDLVSANLSRLEDAVGDAIARRPREYMLRELHTNTLSAFVNSPGFGVMRMSVPEWGGVHIRREEGERTQPGHRSGADDWLKPATVLRWPYGMLKLHEANVLEFVNPQGFGIIDSRKKVTGFVGHGFARLPDTDENWSIATVELMGLLLHPEPAVYLSHRLPAMDELKGAPTRKPDEFESAALERIRKGDDLVTAETEDGTRMRMLGSIRNGNTCQKCHGGDRGDLLGAFSYVLSKK